MNCPKCGTEAPKAGGSPFCTTCGANLPGGASPMPVGISAASSLSTGGPSRTSGMAITGFVLSFFCGLLGLIFSLMGRSECKKSGGTVTGEGFALAGIIISIISLAVGVLGILAAIAIPAFMDYSSKAKRSDAHLELNKLEKQIKMYHIEKAQLPIGATQVTPNVDCCTQNYQGKRKCFVPQSEWQQEPIWRDLDFAIFEPGYFRYSYESDGKSFTARAIGDLDCDTVEVTYELRGRIVDGNVQSDGIRAPTNSD